MAIWGVVALPKASMADDAFILRGARLQASMVGCFGFRDSCFGFRVVGVPSPRL